MCWEQIRPLESRAGQGRWRVGLAGHLRSLWLSVGFSRAQLSLALAYTCSTSHRSPQTIGVPPVRQWINNKRLIFSKEPPPAGSACRSCADSGF